MTVVKAGEKVTSSAATLGKLGFTPFTYGLEAQYVYDKGNVFERQAVLRHISDDANRGDVRRGCQEHRGALARGPHYPTIAAVPAIINGYKNVLAIAVGTDYTFPLADKVKEYLANPGAFASAAPAARRRRRRRGQGAPRRRAGARRRRRAWTSTS